MIFWQAPSAQFTQSETIWFFTDLGAISGQGKNPWDGVGDNNRDIF